MWSCLKSAPPEASTGPRLLSDSSNIGLWLKHGCIQSISSNNCLEWSRVFAVGGTVAAEHGRGQLKTQWMPKMRSAAELALMASMKQQLDPQGLFNQGKVLPNA